MAATVPEHFINREWSWLAFNDRVLEEAKDEDNPLLERLKFLGIVSSNLDEFFEVRVAILKQQIESGVTTPSPDGRMPEATFEGIRSRTKIMVAEQYRVWSDSIRPALAEAGIRILSPSDLTAEDLAWVDKFYFDQVSSVLTPLGIDSAHPFPELLNKSLNIMVELSVERSGASDTCLAIVQVPRILSRLVKLPRRGEEVRYLLLEAVILRHLTDLFSGNRILGCWCFRVTRNSELYIDEESAANLLKAVETELFNRRKGAAVRLEIESGCPVSLQSGLLEYLTLTEADVYEIDGPLDPIPLTAVGEGERWRGLRDEQFVAAAVPAFEKDDDLFEVLRRRDVLMHHPYERFSCVVEFIEQAADDPRVLAIKQTLYRSGSDERIFRALMRAARKGKQVTVVIELKARFDEDNNIRSARKLEQEGVHVLYGMMGYKIHGKMCLIVRRDEDRIRRYLHLSTGNYNATTARFYTDIGYLSARKDLGEDVAGLFNLLTGICRFQPTKKLLVAPFQLHQALLDLVQQEADYARQGLPARIIAKMNALVDQQIIQALYRASQSGVQVELIVRGVCCLRPGVPGLSERIRVRSVVGRFLEHSRIYYFENNSRPKVFLGSADWMPRNFFRRIETVFPIEDGILRDRIINEILSGCLADNLKSRLLGADGIYRRPAVDERVPRQSCQQEFMRLAQTSRSGPAEGKAGEPIRMVVRRQPFERGGRTGEAASGSGGSQD